MHWYDDYDHLGYNLDGQKINKPKRGDELDNFLNKMDNPKFGITVHDPSTGQDVVLPKSVVDTIKRLRSGKLPDANYDMFAEWPSWFSDEVLETPVRDLPESKKSFLPSISEKKIVGKMVHAIKMGWMKPTSKVKEDPDDPDKKTFYMLWKTDDQIEGSKTILFLAYYPMLLSYLFLIMIIIFFGRHTFTPSAAQELRKGSPEGFTGINNSSN